MGGPDPHITHHCCTRALLQLTPPATWGSPDERAWGVGGLALFSGVQTETQPASAWEPPPKGNTPRQGIRLVHHLLWKERWLKVRTRSDPGPGWLVRGLEGWEQGVWHVDGWGSVYMAV